MPKIGFLDALGYFPVPLRRLLIRCLVRSRRNHLFLRSEAFRGKRVLILGPARTLADDLTALDPGRYDLFVKFNNGLETAVPGLNGSPLRCDMLFHSLTDDARPVTASALCRANVRWLVHRTPTRGAYLHTLKAARDLGRVAQVRCLEHGLYARLRDRLNGASPSSGLVCACFFLSAPVDELAIAGFTFFTTQYVPGYDDAVMSDAAAVRITAHRGHHDPAGEARILAQDVAQARANGRNVVLGPQVVRALSEIGVT